MITITYHEHFVLRFELKSPEVNSNKQIITYMQQYNNFYHATSGSSIQIYMQQTSTRFLPGGM